MALDFAETKGSCHVAYDGVAGESYRFPDGSTWSVARHWATAITGFKAILLTSASDTVLAFAGTDSIVDVIVDISQVLGDLPPQYTQALILSAQAQRRLGTRVSLAGHSLGGGLAAYCSVHTRMPACTVNPAPLIGGATLRALVGNNSQITNYIPQGGEFVSSSPGRNPGRDVEVASAGGTFGFFTDHMLANVGPGVPLPVKL